MKSYKKEARDNAFKTWRRCGQNVEETLRELKKQGYSISKPTLYDWMAKYQWEDRAARADAEEQKVKDTDLSSEERVIADLIKQKEKYDLYFETLGPKEIDTNATYAYASLLKTIHGIQTKGGADKAASFLDFMNELVGYLMESDKDLAKRFDEHIEKFAARMKARA